VVWKGEPFGLNSILGWGPQQSTRKDPDERWMCDQDAQGPRKTCVPCLGDGMMVKMLQSLPRKWYDGEDAPISAQAMV